MPNFDFQVIVPAIVKKNEAVKMALSQIPAAGDTVSIAIIDPTGRTITVQAQTASSVGGISDLYYALFTPSYNGTHLIVAQIVTSAPATTVGLGSFIASAWLDNIDKPISDITKSNTEISRLRTQYDRSRGQT